MLLLPLMASPAPLPSVSVEQAQTLVRELFGMSSEASELPSYIDRNFRIRSTENSDIEFVLKVANSVTTLDEMQFECAAMNVLASSDIGIRCPTVKKTTAGKDLGNYTSDTGQLHVVRLVTYVPGQLWADAGTPSDELLKDLGRKLARVDRQLENLDHPGKRQDFPWDLCNAEWISDHLRLVKNEQRRVWVNHALLQFNAHVAPELDSLPRGVIHNDANDYNLTVENDTVCGLFDFGDMISSCRVFEPVIAATYAAFYRPDGAINAIALVTAGYHEVTPLSGIELDLVFHAVRARLAVSLVSSAKSALSDPDNDHTSVSEQDGWKLLETLSALSPRAATNSIRSACGAELWPAPRRSIDELLTQRKASLGPSLSVAYSESPLSINRGYMQYLFDEDGYAYMDCVNNVCGVGHCHPHVVAAATKQIATLNTNSRYLHNTIVDYSQRLAATLPEHLEVCFFVCSGSEANELALRLSRAYTGRRDILVLDHAYHGTTNTLVDLSPYKFDGPGGEGRRDGIHVTASPDPYRNPESRDGKAYAEVTVGKDLKKAPVAAFFAESLLGCGGQIVPPPGYLKRAFDLAREAGAVPIADEVQVGFGRAGSHMWAFDAQGAVPDIVTMGKPIGNGHPMAAVVTTRAIANSFANGMEYFNTFGGNPVSCSVGMAVLDVIENDKLQENAVARAEQITQGFEAMKSRHPLISDIRGLGLFLGIELVRDHETKEPAADEADEVIRRCREEGLLVSTDGPFHNVLKIKPPLQFSETDAKILLDAVDRALTNIEANSSVSN